MEHEEPKYLFYGDTEYDVTDIRRKTLTFSNNSFINRLKIGLDVMKQLKASSKIDITVRSNGKIDVYSKSRHYR